MLPHSIYQYTRQQYADAIYASLGKGYQHAKHLYSEWFRDATFLGSHPCFNNAPQLLADMQEITSLDLPRESRELREENTTKLLLQTHDAYDIEMVAIPMDAGFTLCVSSQIGCRMGCTFCETGRMGLIRHLSAEEIVQQVFHALFIKKIPLRNLVFMGMGEPFDNYDAVIQAIRVITDSGGLAIGAKRITVSTSGRVDGIQRLSEEKALPIRLAVSINAPNNAIRKKIMPLTRKYSMEQLYDTMLAYCQKTKQRIFAEYILIKDVTDKLDAAQDLAKYLEGLDVTINLIPYNPQSQARYEASEVESQRAFQLCLRERGYHALLRGTKGQQSMAACGQLGNPALRNKRM